MKTETPGKQPHFFDRLLDITPSMLAVVVAIMGVMILAEITTRSAFGHSVGPVTELSEIALSYIPFVGAAWLLKHEGHVNIDIVYQTFKPVTKSAMMAITSLICTGVSLVLVIYGATTTWSLYVREITTVSILREPVWIYIVIIPIGGLLLTIQFIRRTVKYWKLWAKHEGPPKLESMES